MDIPLKVTAVPTKLASLISESRGMCKWNIIPVAPTPIEVVPSPTIIPESPEYPVFCTTSHNSVCSAGGPIKTKGGFVVVYPLPGLVMVTPVTTPLVIVASAVAVTDPTPILTSGVVEYPTPPLLMVIEVIVPAEETTAVAAAPVTTTGFTNFTPF